MQTAKVRGVIDILADGYRVLNRHPWLLAVPILLDLFLWLGPEVTAEAVASQLVRRSPDMEGLAEAFSNVNVLGVLAWRFSSAVGIVRLGTNPSTDLSNGGALAGTLVGCAIAGLALFSLFYALLVSAAQGVSKPAPGVLRLARGGFVRMCLLWGAILASIVAGAALVGALLLAGPIGEVLAGLLVMAGGLAAIFGWLLLYLVHPAIFIGDQGVRAAVAESSTIVKANAWATLRLFALVVLITFGTGIAWQGLISNRIGALVAILGNAYIVTGLAVAVPLFYLDRRRPAGAGAPVSAG